MHNSPGGDEHPPPLDWAAYGRLQRRSQKLDTSFDLNGIERGLNRLLKRPERKSYGVRLARRLERDARKFLRAQGDSEILLGDLDIPARPDDPSAMEIEDLESAVGLIQAGMLRLDGRHRLAVTARALDRPADELGIKPRQLRNLLREARTEVRLEPGVADAYELLHKGLSTWRYLTVKLCASLLSA